MGEREILFRGKDLQEQNGWLYGYFYKSDINKRERESGKATLIFTPDCDTFIYVPEYHNSWMVKAETVGQYTGVKDKNGTRIFEGDIIKITGFHTTAIAAVKYGSTSEKSTHWGWYFDDNDGHTYFLMSKAFCKDYNAIIIGNIHDNQSVTMMKSIARILKHSKRLWRFLKNRYRRTRKGEFAPVAAVGIFTQLR